MLLTLARPEREARTTATAALRHQSPKPGSPGHGCGPDEVPRRRAFPVLPRALGVSDNRGASYSSCCPAAVEAQLIGHDQGLVNVLAPWRNAATAAGLLIAKSG